MQLAEISVVSVGLDPGALVVSDLRMPDGFATELKAAGLSETQGVRAASLMEARARILGPDGTRANKALLATAAEDDDEEVVILDEQAPEGAEGESMTKRRAGAGDERRTQAAEDERETAMDEEKETAMDEVKREAAEEDREDADDDDEENDERPKARKSKARLVLERRAAGLVRPGVDVRTASDRDIMVSAVSWENASAASMPPVELAEAFASIVARRDRALKGLDAAKGDPKTAAASASSGNSKVVAARAAMIEHMESAWKRTGTGG